MVLVIEGWTRVELSIGVDFSEPFPTFNKLTQPSVFLNLGARFSFSTCNGEDIC
jgi:hypothetical protein